MKVPTVGEVIEDAGGKRWQVQGVHLVHYFAEGEMPETWTLHVDVEPVVERVPIPESIRREFDS